MDTHNINLDDISKTSFCIPFKPVKQPGQGDKPKLLIPKSYSDDRDLEDGRELRFAAYKSAWSKCLNRMQQIVHDLQNELVKAVIHEIETSHSDTLPGLPYPELPVISLINPGLGSALLENITLKLEGKSWEDIGGPVKSFVTHLYPGDVPNLVTGLRTIISGLVEQEELESVRRKPASSLANYDINYLVAWYKAWVDTQADTELRPNVVVLLHDFEQFDPYIMQDIFDIFSKYISQIPFVFLLSMTSPISNYINLSYTQATLSLLRVRTFSAPTGNSVLEELFLKSFFDIEFQADITLGPTTLKYLHDYFTRYTPSVDAIFTILQLAHLRHFTSEPLTVLVTATPSTETLTSPSAETFTAALRARIQAIADTNGDIDIDTGDESQLVHFVDDARVAFQRRYTDLRLGLNLVLLLNAFLKEQGYNTPRWMADTTGKGGGNWEAIIGVFDVTSVQRVIKELGQITRRLNRGEMKAALDRIYQYFHALPIKLSSTVDEQGAKMKTVELRNQLAQSANDTGMFGEVGHEFTQWLSGYLRSKLRPLDECVLWDVWYTGLAPFPSELINPSVRASVIAGLMHPHAFTVPLQPSISSSSTDKKGKRKSGANVAQDEREHALHDLPDASILFARYLDSGRMINAWDWFEAFKLVLDEQRDAIRERALAAAAAATSPGSPRKRDPKGKGKGKKEKESPIQTIQTPVDVVPEVEEDDEKWAVQVQARFVRALHELDYLGFIRHTGRKADHLVRTVFEVDEAH